MYLFATLSFHSPKVYADIYGQRFAQLSRFLPFLPVFGGGQAQFQPVFVGDIARAVEIVSRDDASVRRAVAGKIIEAGGPDGKSSERWSLMS